MNEGLNNEEIEERFFVRGRMEVLNVLNDLIHRCEPVTVSFNDGADSLVTTLLEAKESELIFEASNDAAANRRLSASPTCSFSAFPDGIRIQFSATQPSPKTWDDSDVFSVPLPELVTRLQRQQSFRMLIPSEARPAVRLVSAGGEDLGHWPLHNLSVGGLAVTVDAQWRLGPGQTIARAGFALPDYGDIDCAVVMRHETELTELVERAAEEVNSPLRIGVAFVDLPPVIGVAIQRYIIKVEHERRNAATDYGADDHD